MIKKTFSEWLQQTGCTGNLSSFNHFASQNVVIIVTSFKADAEEVHRLVGKQWDSKGFWSPGSSPEKTYVETWYWRWNGKEFIGTGGPQEYKNLTKRFPEGTFYDIVSFKQTLTQSHELKNKPEPA